MESCLKKLVLDAPETGFQDAERKPLVPPGRELVPGGIHWRQMGVDSLPSGVQKVYSRLLAVPGGELPDSTPVRVDAPAHLGATGPGRLTRGEYKEAGLAKRGHK